jgi:SAM-dependent methyltransferase
MLGFRRQLRIHEDPVVRSFIQRHVASPETFVSRIDGSDEMFLFDLALNKGDRRRTAIGYYTLGARIFSAIKQIGDWHCGGLETVPSFLDFASGYGRSTRFLSRVLPPSSIWACDIYAKAVDFQKRSYGVNGIVSVPDPARFPGDRKFDYIFASSFFTHMPQETFGAWMKTLFELLTPQGILAFSTHDFSLIPPAVARPDAGILFATTSESRTLPGSQYGSTYVNERFVGEVVAEVTAGKGMLHRIERGLCYFQDIYVLASRLNRGFAELGFLHEPRGFLDLWAEGSDDGIRLAGWAADLNPGGSIKEVSVQSGDRIIATVAPGHDRPDVAEYFNCPSAAFSGWRCQIDRRAVRWNDTFEISATNHLGARTVIVFDYPKLVRRRCPVRR